ncbi:MAG: hypothetical protein KDH20_12125 [Rhodocyclaceae bacterium]|nr:hypothetical protein [Rhodocyclaceae bacterium]
MKTRLIGATLLALATALPAAAAPDQPMCAMAGGPGSLASMGGHQMQGLLDGRGMGMAKAAELNGYPGPKHVLELAAELELDDTQRERTQHLFDTMQADARQVGAQLVEEERRLDRLFKDGLATEAGMQSIMDRIGSLQGTLRARHLATHIAQREILDDGQIDRYMELRSASRGQGGPGMHHAPGQHGGPMMQHHGDGGHACGAGGDYEAMHRRHHPDGGGPR